VRETKKTIRLDPYEEGAVIEGLNNVRTEKLENNECADFISGLMLKIIRSPSKSGKARVRDEAR